MSNDLSPSQHNVFRISQAGVFLSSLSSLLSPRSVSVCAGAAVGAGRPLWEGGGAEEHAEEADR